MAEKAFIISWAGHVKKHRGRERAKGIACVSSSFRAARTKEERQQCLLSLSSFLFFPTLFLPQKKGSKKKRHSPVGFFMLLV
jgi:hypothetical protein